MASYLDKAKINTAITDNTKLDLGHQAITTEDFMQLNVAMLHEMVPGEKIDIKMETFARLNPLPVPTFGRAAMRSRAFFVPFRTVFRGWNDFIVDNVHVASDGYQGSAGICPTVPFVKMSTLANTFKNSVATSSTGNGLIYASTNPTVYDISWTGSNGGYNFTVMGRQAIKLLEQLGYKIDFDCKDEVPLSALPLLALARVYVDYYFPQQYSNYAIYDRLLSLCNYDSDQGGYVGSFELVSTDVLLILTACSYVSYDSDYFVSAWDTANQPNQGNCSDFKIANIDAIGEIYGSSLYKFKMQQSGVTNNSQAAINTGDNLDRVGKLTAPFATTFITGATSATGSVTNVTAGISEYMLHSLHALTDYMKRHQLAGARAFDRYLARFGKALSSEKLNRSIYLGAAIQDIQIGDVMSTSDTVGFQGAQLGAYAGKGISYGNGQFDYSTDEFGYIIILNSIVPATGYFQGIDRQVMRTTKLQFWTPEFDSLGTQPITAAELYIPQKSGDMGTSDTPYDVIFGFTPRYADYKVAHDSLTGNFRLDSLNGGSTINAADSWHLMRTFDGNDFNNDWTEVVHSADFVLGKYDFAQYKRLFYDIDEDAPDNFTVIHNFEIASYAPMKALYDSYEFEDKGKKVMLDANGVRLN